MDLSTRSRVLGLTISELLRTREAVATLTPACAATSLKLAMSGMYHVSDS
jgi:hypothetical protein